MGNLKDKYTDKEWYELERQALEAQKQALKDIKEEEMKERESKKKCPHCGKKI